MKNKITVSTTDLVTYTSTSFSSFGEDAGNDNVAYRSLAMRIIREMSDKELFNVFTFGKGKVNGKEPYRFAEVTFLIDSGDQDEL